MLNTVDKKRMVELYSEYIKATGIGQFSYYGFADWLIQDEPDLATKLLEEQLRRLDNNLNR